MGRLRGRAPGAASALLGCLWLSACVPAPTDPDAVRAAIEQRNAQLERAYAAGDAGQVAAAFVTDGWQLPPNNAPLVGRAAIEAFWGRALSWGTWQFSLKTAAVTVSGSLAVERGHYQLKFTPGAGAAPGMAGFLDHGNYLVQWRHESDGEWRAVVDAPVSEVLLQPAEH